MKHFCIYPGFLSMLLMSCNPPKTLYVSNKTGKPIILFADSKNASIQVPNEVAFNDSLNGKRIEPGHIIINFGSGKWKKADKMSLKTILPTIIVRKEGQADSLRLPGNTRITHIGLFVNELVLKIDHLKQ